MSRTSDKFSIAFDHSPLALTITSLDTGRLVDVNQGFVRLSGYSREESLGRTPDELGLWIEPTQRSERFRLLRAGEPVPDLEARFRLKNGDEAVGVIASSLVEIDGRPCVLSSMLDVTARKRAEQALREQEQRYRAIVETQSEMVCRFQSDGTILFVNTAYARARATTVEALIGANFWQFVPEPDRRRVGAMLDALSPEVPEARIENRFETADGVRWILWINRALTFDATGRPLELQSSGVDISEMRRAQEALRHSEARYRHIFDTVGVSIWDEDFSEITRALATLRESGVRDFTAYLAEHPEWVERARAMVRVRAVNAATLRLFEAQSQAQLLESLPAIFTPEARQIFTGQLLAIAEGRASFEAETTLRTLGGRTLAVLLTMTLPPDRRLDSILVTLTDITDRKTAEMQVRASESHFRQMAEALQQSNRTKDEFLATLSHELRTPLNAVLGWAHMLRSGALPPDVAARALDSLERNARAQTQLIDDLLDMSRIVSGRLQIAETTVDVGAVVAAAIDTVRPAAVTKGVELQVMTDTVDSSSVKGDPDRLRQVLWNLLTNAIKFTPTGGRVSLALSGTDDDVVVRVHDSGEGIEPEFLPHVFERFRQADATSTRRHGGLGLGLSIARHLAEAHGGRITVASDGRNRGATFTLQVPRERAPLKDRHAVGANPHRSETPLAGRSLLVVDDEDDARELFRVALELAGGEVVVASCAADALDALRTHHFDVVLADLGTPGSGGVELVRAMRALPPPIGQLPALAVTAYTSLRERELALEAGFTAHVAKPIEIERLLTAVLDALSDERPARLPMQ